MSNEAINWAFAQEVQKSSAKFVLVAMANLAGDGMTCWPSYKHLTTATAQNIKTVEAALRRLREDGFISDTGERKGTTGQVIVYRLNTPEFGGVLPLAKTPEIPINTTENGGASVDGKTPKFSSKTPKFTGKDPQISQETPPKTGGGTIKEPSRNHQGTKEKANADRVDLLVGVDPQVIADYLQVRKAKRAGALTETAVAGLQREAEKAGLTLAQAVAYCCEAGWQGFNAGWYGQRAGTTAVKPTGKHAGFQTLNYREGVTSDGSLI